MANTDYKNILTFEQDMSKPVKVRHLTGSLFENSKKALRLRCQVFRNGQPETLQGNVQCLGLGSDGVTRWAEGNISGNVAYVDLPKSFFYPGIVNIVMYNINDADTIQTPILALSGLCQRTNGEGFVDTGNVIPSMTAYENLTTQIQAAANTITNGLSFSAEAIAGNRYKCIVTKS